MNELNPKDCGRDSCVNCQNQKDVTMASNRNESRQEKRKRRVDRRSESGVGFTPGYEGEIRTDDRETNRETRKDIRADRQKRRQAFFANIKDSLMIVMIILGIVAVIGGFIFIRYIR